MYFDDGDHYEGEGYELYSDDLEEMGQREAWEDAQAEMSGGQDDEQDADAFDHLEPMEDAHIDLMYEDRFADFDYSFPDYPF